MVVTCVSTHDWIGAPSRWRASSISSSSARTVEGRSVAGLMPTTASPAPCSSPSTSDAVMPTGSSVGWFGCRRVASRPSRPIVVRRPVTTRVLRPTATRSPTRMSLLTAATISGVSPGARSLSTVVSASQDSSQSRKPPTVSDRTGANAAASWESMISRVTSSSS